MRVPFEVPPARAPRPVLACALSIAAALATFDAHATVVQCGGAETCATEFSVLVGDAGMEGGGGQLIYNSRTGDVSLDLSSIHGMGASVMNGVAMWDLGGGSQVSITTLGGNADPILSFGVGATAGASGVTATFAFNLPIALSGPINATSSVSYSLTSTTPAGASVTPTFGNTKIVRAFEVDTDVVDILPDLNKGVDVGNAFGFSPGAAVGGLTMSSPVYSAASFFTGDLDYELMSVLVAFRLSPNSSVGMSGFVQQIAVPLPAALPLLLSALAGFGGVAARRRRADA